MTNYWSLIILLDFDFFIKSSTLKSFGNNERLKPWLTSGFEHHMNFLLLIITALNEINLNSAKFSFVFSLFPILLRCLRQFYQILDFF